MGNVHHSHNIINPWLCTAVLVLIGTLRKRSTSAFITSKTLVVHTRSYILYHCHWKILRFHKRTRARDVKPRQVQPVIRCPSDIQRYIYLTQHLFSYALFRGSSTLYDCLSEKVIPNFLLHNCSIMTPRKIFTHKVLPYSKDLGLVAACFRGGQLKPGVESGPREFLSAGLVEELSTTLKYVVHGDTRPENIQELRPGVGKDEPHRGMRNPRLVSAATKEIAKKVYDHAKAGRFVLSLGGDHSVGIGTVAGMAKAVREHRGQEGDLAVIWVDAHADLNTPESSSSGNIHGMPLAFLTGLARSDHKDIFDWLGDDHRIKFDHLVYIGLRDLDDSEKQTIRDKGIRAFSINNVEGDDIKRVLDSTLAHIGPDLPIHLVFDIDALDPYWAPSTGIPTEQGLSLRECCVIAERLHQSGQLVGMDVVEVNPKLQPEGAIRTVRSGISVIKSALGFSLL